MKENIICEQEDTAFKNRPLDYPDNAYIQRKT